ncbi:MAG: hypothetical protein ACI8QC_000875 [Planctomycetota bacterium]|jgi:hypothetical protein
MVASQDTTPQNPAIPARAGLGGLLAIPSWVLLSLLRRPTVWIWLGLLSAFWPALVKFSELGLTTDQATPQAALYELCFVSLLVGAFVGTSLLDKHQALFLRAAPNRRLGAEALGLASACIPFLIAALAPALAYGAGTHDLGFADLPARCLLAGAHMVAVAMVLLHLPLGTTARRAILPFAVWLLPATVPPESALSPWIHRVLGIAQRLTPDGVLNSGGGREVGDWAGWLLTTLGWVLLAWLTARAQPRNHAIRDPR